MASNPHDKRRGLSRRRKSAHGLFGQKRHELLRKLIDGLGPHMFVGLMTPDGILIEANRPALEAAGLKPDDVLGKPVEETYWWSYSEPVQQQFREAVRRAAAGQSSRYDVQVRIAEDQLIWIDFSLQPLADKTGKIVYLVGSANVITDRKQAEEALRENRLFLQRILESEPGTVYIYDVVERRNVWINPHWSQHFGYSSEETQGMGNELLPKILHPDDLERIVAHHDAWREGGEAAIREIEYRLRDKTGRWRWLRSHETVFHRDANGQVVQILGIAHDITDMVDAREALRASEARLRAILEAEPACIKIFGPDGTLVDINAAGLAFLELGCLEEMGNPSGYPTYIPEHWEMFQTLVRNAAQGKSGRLQYLLQGKKGARHWMEGQVVPLRLNPEGPTSVLVVSYDITDRKQAEEAAKESRQFLDLALRVGKIGWWVVNPATDKNYVSPEFREICGIPADAEAPPFNEWANRVHPQDRDRFYANFQQGLRELLPSMDLSVRFLHPDGSYRWLNTRGSVVKDLHGTIRVLGVTQDITAQKQAEEELRQRTLQLQALTAHLQTVREEERSRMAREIHDELGQLLTALRINLNWLCGKLPPAEQRLKEKAQATVQLVDSTIDTVRRIAAELRPGVLDLGVAAAAEWQVKQFQEQANIACELSVSPEDIPLEPERATHLFRILQESLTNVARHAQASVVRVVLKRTPEELVLEVRDNGKGIGDESSRRAGSLGLLGMRERAALIGGTLTIEPAPGGGTRVCCRVPLLPVGQTLTP